MTDTTSEACEALATSLEIGAPSIVAGTMNVGRMQLSMDMGEAAAMIRAMHREKAYLIEQLALRSESAMHQDMQEIMRINNTLVAERDAEETEKEHFCTLAFVDLGANPPVAWRDRAYEAEARVKVLAERKKSALAILQEPGAVYVNMLCGTIPKLSWADCCALWGKVALAESAEPV